jgi:two-component system, NarL family, response regulator DesR
MTRGLRILYVENDEALLGNSLSVHHAIDSLAKAKSSHEAFTLAASQSFDAALVDISLGPDSLNGVELAQSLREKNEHLGIVLLSQNMTKNYLANMPGQFDYGWAAIQKSATLSVDYLVDVLSATAKGLTVSDSNSQLEAMEPDNLSAALNAKQRQVIGLAATGLDATEIAKQLGLASVTVRQELSKCYKILIPNPKPGTDLRTAAVLRYLRETRGL